MYVSAPPTGIGTAIHLLGAIASRFARLGGLMGSHVTRFMSAFRG